MVYAVILAGGRGERFWPLSKRDRPKQFLKLTSDRMMLEETIDRILPLVPIERVRIVTGASMAGFILGSVANVQPINVLGEPQGRNTCAAIGLAAVHLLNEDPDAVMIVLSADHLIRPAERLLSILDAGATIAAAEDHLITIGIVPTRPETGYGYIKLGEMYKHEKDNVVYQVAGFTEKPRAAVAQEYYFSRNYLWNSGMFIWSARAIMDAISECLPQAGKQLALYKDQIGTDSEGAALEELYEKIKPISIDFAVLEKASNVLSIKADIIWDDVGDWTALQRYKELDRDNNVIVGDVALVDSYDITVINDAVGLVACLGVSDLVVVRSDNVTLILHKTQAQEMKKLLARLAEDEKNTKYL